MVAFVPMLATRAGLPVYIPHLRQSGTAVRPRLIERLTSAGRMPGVTLIYGNTACLINYEVVRWYSPAFSYQVLLSLGDLAHRETASVR